MIHHDPPNPESCLDGHDLSPLTLPTQWLHQWVDGQSTAAFSTAPHELGTAMLLDAEHAPKTRRQDLGPATGFVAHLASDHQWSDPVII